MKKFIFSLTLFSSLQVFAWGDVGHEATAEIAQRHLTPKAQLFVRQILGVEPLAVASTWPDHVRSDSRFSGFAPYHFIEIPLDTTFTNIPDADKAPQDAHVLIAKAVEQLGKKNTLLSREQKMLLLRYLVHLVGDVHQPLHIGNGRDMGGNLCSVKWSYPDQKSSNFTTLHSLWDSSVIDYIGYYFKKPYEDKNSKAPWYGYKELVEIIEKDTKVDFQQTVQGQPADWYEESRSLHLQVYPDASKDLTPETRPYCRVIDFKTKKQSSGAYDLKKLPELKQEYFEKAIPIVKMQILKGGYRLANLLNQIAEDKDLASTKTDEQIIKSVQFTQKDLKTRTPQSSKKKKK